MGDSSQPIRFTIASHSRESPSTRSNSLARPTTSVVFLPARGHRTRDVNREYRIAESELADKDGESYDSIAVLAIVFR